MARTFSAAMRRRPLGAGLLPGSAGVDEMLSQVVERFELLELLALGAAFQFRLSGTVAASWAPADHAKHRPALTAALSGRFAPVAAEWLGIDPDEVAVTSYDGTGWGMLSAAASLRASLPVSWLSDVWACGLGVVDGHLVVAVEEPGHPRARVLALRSPGAEPVVLEVEADDSASDALPHWSISDLESPAIAAVACFA